MKQIVGSVGKGEGEKRLMIIFQTWLDNLKTFEREVRLEKRIFFVDYGNRRIKLMNKIRERKDKTSLSLFLSLLFLPLVFLTLTPFSCVSRANGTGCDESCAGLRREIVKGDS